MRTTFIIRLFFKLCVRLASLQKRSSASPMEYPGGRSEGWEDLIWWVGDKNSPRFPMLGGNPQGQALGAPKIILKRLK